MHARNLTSNSKPIRVAIIGAGIAGLATALAIARLVPEEALKIDVYEQASEIKEIGHGIVFWSRMWPIFEHLGIANELEKNLGRKILNIDEKTLMWKVMKCDQEKWEDMFEFYKAGQFLQFHRAAVQKILLDALPSSVQVHLSYRLTSYDESDDNVTLNFENQPPTECDLLVAADGLKSHMRAHFISKSLPDQQESIHPVWDGTIVYRSLINSEKVKKIYPDHFALSKAMLYTGHGKFGVSYPILQGRFVALSVVSVGNKDEYPTSADADKDFVLSLFFGWSKELLGLIECGEHYNQWAIQYLNPLRSFAVGRIALVGDAAHGMMPSKGSGAGQAIEDAYILAHLLLKATQHYIPIDRITEAYTRTREPLANLVLQRSYDLTQVNMFLKEGYEGVDSGSGEAMNMKQFSEKFRLEFERMFDWWESYPVEGEVEKALSFISQ